MRDTATTAAKVGHYIIGRHNAHTRNKKRYLPACRHKNATDGGGTFAPKKRNRAGQTTPQLARRSGEARGAREKFINFFTFFSNETENNQPSLLAPKASLTCLKPPPLGDGVVAKVWRQYTRRRQGRKAGAAPARRYVGRRVTPPMRQQGVVVPLPSTLKVLPCCCSSRAHGVVVVVSVAWGRAAHADLTKAPAIALREGARGKGERSSIMRSKKKKCREIITQAGRGG